MLSIGRTNPEILLINCRDLKPHKSANSKSNHCRLTKGRTENTGPRSISVQELFIKRYWPRGKHERLISGV